jgi:hypothetical protein
LLYRGSLTPRPALIAADLSSRSRQSKYLFGFAPAAKKNQM